MQLTILYTTERPSQLATSIRALRRVHSIWTELNWPEQVDPVTRLAHWSRAPASRLLYHSYWLAAVKLERLVLGYFSTKVAYFTHFVRLLGEDFIARFFVSMIYLLQIKSYFSKYLMRRTAYIHCLPSEKIIKLLPAILSGIAATTI